jgi:hypothetical protein
MKMVGQCLLILILWCCFFSSSGFFPGTSRFGKSFPAHSASLSGSKTAKRMNPYDPTRVVDSKLLPPHSEDDFSNLMREHNISNYHMNDDPEVRQWSPPMDFFEKFGVQNQRDGSTRSLMDVRTEFYSTYKTPILPQYKTFISDLMNVLTMQRMDARFEYDALLAFGICTQYYTIMKSYAFQEEVCSLFCFVLFSFLFFISHSKQTRIEITVLINGYFYLSD